MTRYSIRNHVDVSNKLLCFVKMAPLAQCHPPSASPWNTGKAVVLLYNTRFDLCNHYLVLVRYQWGKTYRQSVGFTLLSTGLTYLSFHGFCMWANFAVWLQHVPDLHLHRLM